MSSLLKLFTIITLLYALRQENCKNNKNLLGSKKYPGFHGPGQPAIYHVIVKKRGHLSALFWLPCTKLSNAVMLHAYVHSAA